MSKFFLCEFLCDLLCLSSPASPCIAPAPGASCITSRRRMLDRRPVIRILASSLPGLALLVHLLPVKPAVVLLGRWLGITSLLFRQGCPFLRSWLGITGILLWQGCTILGSWLGSAILLFWQCGAILLFWLGRFPGSAVMFLPVSIIITVYIPFPVGINVVSMISCAHRGFRLPRIRVTVGTGSVISRRRPVTSTIS